MKQEQFEAAHGGDWRAFEEWLDLRGLVARGRAQAPFPVAEVPRRYRDICRHLALARGRDYGAALVERLHRLAVAGHDAVYGAPGGFWARTRRYLSGGFAAEVRALRRFVLVSFVLLFGPGIALGWATRADPDFVYHVLEPSQVWSVESMYSDTADKLGRRERDAGDDTTMFGFYIYNNIGIAFRCYAGGVLFGLGSGMALLYNGVFMGAVEGRLVARGHTVNFYSFVSGHAAFELFAIVLAGACGLRIGWALLAPGRRRRGHALKVAAVETAGVMIGAAVMLLIAAAIEAFWSSLRLPLPVKVTVGAVLALLLAAYFLFAGRTRAAR